MEHINKILIVDDDSAGTLLTQIIIQEFDPSIKVDTVLNGDEAIKYLDKNCCNDDEHSDCKCPELILLDVRMPVMDGFEFLEELKSHAIFNRNIPIAMLSTSSFEKDIAKAKDYQVVEYIEKPLSIKALSTVLQKI
jgi:CheY-like chemotaxis protein